MLIFESAEMRRLMDKANRFARTSATILIHGESGTGKELLARHLHEHSLRRDEPYVCVNCATFTEQLAESDLLGHEQGSFTGAVKRRQGCFELAGRGTVFLDEIGEIPSMVQAKLLRVIEDAEIRRVGGHDVVPIHARIIAATNRTLSREVQQGRFREDLYHRLSVLTLEIPSLRQRHDDIPALTRYFIQRFGREGEVPVTAVAPAVMRQLLDYSWPGNVRQLRNIIHRACIESLSGTIEQIELPNDDGPESDDNPAVFEDLTLREIERVVILARLKRFQGNRTEAAAQLGVTPRTLRNKVKQYEMAGLLG